jgi:trigger factor
MKVIKTDNSPTNVTLKVNGDATDLAPIKRHTLGHFVDQVRVPGFRKGKAPVDLIEKHVNQQALLDEFMEHALNELFGQAVKSENLKPVGQPDVQLKKFVPYTEMEFEATIDVLGAVTLPDYKKIKIAKSKVEITAKDVNDVLESLKQRSAERKAKEGVAKNGDEVTLDFAGTDDKGKAVAGAEGQDYPLVLGSNSFIPGFEEKLIGMKAGDEKEFVITFPKDYGVAALQSKKVTFKVKIKLVSEVIEPKLDDDFAKKIGPFESFKELKDDIKAQVKLEKENQAKVAYENELIKKITDKAKLEVPSALIEDQLERMEASEKQNLAYQGVTWPEHLEQEGLDEQGHRDRHRDEAAERVKAGLVLSEVSEREGLDVTQEEIDLRIQILRGQYQDPQMQAELDKPENRRDIAARLLTEKTVDKLVGYASK